MNKLSKIKKLNLGCGRDYREGFINIDAREDAGADMVHDITKPFPFASESISEIIAQDVFEHLTLEQQASLFSEVYRLLVKGGKIRIQIPNNEDIWNRFSDDPDTRNHFLFGDTLQYGIWGSHKSGHTPNSFADLAVISGMKIVKFSSETTNYIFEFVKSDLPKLKGIVFINQTMSMGGAENFNAQLLSWFKKQGFPITAYTTLRALNKNLEALGVKAGKIPIVVDIIGDWKGLVKGIVLFPFAAIYYANLTFKNRNSGTILLSGFIEKILVTPWAKFFNIPVVWIEFGPLQTVFSKFFGFPKLLYRLVCRMPDFVIEPSRNTRDSNVNIARLSTAKTVVIPCGIAPLKTVSGRAEKLTAYCVSRMEPGKGQDLLIAAWPKVLARYSKARLYFIGDGDFRPILERQVTKLGIGNSVSFLGWVKDVASTIAPFTVGVFPTVWPLEGMSLVFMEAMSIGKPIVCFGWGSNLELVDSDSAIIVPKGDINGLSRGIIKIFSDPKLAKNLGINAQKRYYKLFALDRIAPRYSKVFLKAQIASENRILLHNLKV